jgi:hypothetical protein
VRLQRGESPDDIRAIMHPGGEIDLDGDTHPEDESDLDDESEPEEAEEPQEGYGDFANPPTTFAPFNSWEHPGTGTAQQNFSNSSFGFPMLPATADNNNYGFAGNHNGDQRPTYPDPSNTIAPTNSYDYTAGFSATGQQAGVNEQTLQSWSQPGPNTNSFNPSFNSQFYYP